MPGDPVSEYHGGVPRWSGGFVTVTVAQRRLPVSEQTYRG